MRKVEWNRKTVSVVLLAVVLPISLVAAFGLTGMFAGSNGSQWPLTITLDKDVYYVDDRMHITITNVSNKTLEFRNTNYDMTYFRWTFEGWKWHDSVPGGAMLTYLKPGETAHVTWQLDGYKLFPPGRYRVGNQYYEVYTGFVVIAGSKSQWPLTIKLDKYEYYPGETMHITITNVSNKTLKFNNTSYNMTYFQFTFEGWKWYDAVPGEAVIVDLKPGETAHVTYTLGGHVHAPFPPGRYRVGNQYYEVYTGFVVKEKPS
ncbi:MAG: immunoglobulin-like domain-containing protein [Thermoproteota archaeon]|nr:immunoglobulin-like domain-containing protein [Thermoproteota archaeon]